MKIVLLTCLVAFATAQELLLRHTPLTPKGPMKKSETILLSNFVQKLDHTNPGDTTVWNQRYYVNNEYFNTTSNNVVFLMVGGEGPIAEPWMEYGAWIQSAKKYGALLFQLEHRFYGESQPFSDLSTEHLSYLSSEQALEDIANFIRKMNQAYSLSPDVKWITFGGSYPGSLVAWLRLKYPDLVHGAMSASGPLLAKLDFTEYYDVVTNDLVATNPECANNLKTAMKQVDDIVNNPDSEEKLGNIFYLCHPFEAHTTQDIQTFYTRITNIIANEAQYHGQNGHNVNTVCEFLTIEALGKEINRLAYLINYLNNGSCIYYNYEGSLISYKNTNVGRDFRPWYYQTCNEFGWYQRTDREDEVYGAGYPLDYFTNLCSDIFGPQFNATYTSNKIDETNANYGGLDINVTNVVYVQGSFDPWSKISLNDPTNEKNPVIVIDGASHCAAMADNLDIETPGFEEAKTKVDKLIGEWLGFN